MPIEIREDIVSKKEKYIWPCTTTLYKKPLDVDRAEGMRLWDAEGQCYLDFFGGCSL
jgi:4-aminobutyrate aminotransferase